MGIYKRGGVYWYEFQFQGVRLRESTHSTSREVASRAERERRRSLELGANNLDPVKRPQMLYKAASEWMAGNPHWSANTRRINKTHLEHVLPVLGSTLLSEIKLQAIAKYQSKRHRDGASNKTVNMEVTALRQILRVNGYWGDLAGKVKMFRTRDDAGRALSADEVSRLDAAAAKSRSRSLPVVLTLLRFTGMRLSELRLMRWRQVDLLGEYVVVGSSKTKGSEGRMIPLGPTSLRTILEWRAKFPDAKPEHYVFPSERYGLDGEKGYKDGDTCVYHIDPEKPISSWKVAWTRVRTLAGVSCRLHDYRHTFVSRLAEGQVPDATLMALTGHLSRKMLELYSHTRVQAKRDAIEALEHSTRRESPQKSPQGPN